MGSVERFSARNVYRCRQGTFVRRGRDIFIGDHYTQEQVARDTHTRRIGDVGFYVYSDITVWLFGGLETETSIQGPKNPSRARRTTIEVMKAEVGGRTRIEKA